MISQSVSGSAAPGTAIKLVVSLGAETTYYTYSTTIDEADDVEKNDTLYIVESASIQLIADGKTVYNTQTTSFPKKISVDNLTVSSGKLKIVWTYVSEEDPDDVYTEEETRSVSFKKAN